MWRRPLPPRARPRAAPRVSHRRSPRAAPRAGAAARLAGATAGLALALALPTAAAAEEGRALYRWTDEGGAVRYTPDPGRIPRGRRGDAQRVEPGEPLPAAGVATAAPPAAEPPGAPSGSAPVPPEAPEPPAPTHPVEASPPGGPSDASDLDARIRELEAAIARDEEALEALIAGPAQGGDAPLAQSPELREIAGRLPALQAELRQLRAERAAQQRP